MMLPVYDPSRPVGVLKAHEYILVFRFITRVFFAEKQLQLIMVRMFGAQAYT